MTTLSWICRIALTGAMTGAVATALPGLPARAQEYPTRNVTIVVPLAAGTGMDTIARIYAEDLAKALGKPVVVENQPGAALMLALQNVARAVPDGHTLVISTSAPMAVSPTLYKRVNYDPEKDFVPLALYTKSPFVLIVNPNLGAATMKEFVKKAQDSATPLTYGTPGTGTLLNLTMETLKRDFRFQISHVPYRSSPQIVTDVIGGHISAAISETGAALPLILEGKVKALGITASVPHPSLPQVPTMADAMGMHGFEAVSWHVLLAPAATPRPVVERLHAEMNRITADRAFQKRVTDIGLMPLDPRPIEEIQQYMNSERVRWRGVVTELGLAGSQ
jgi:tripartite-type tricarboxylate transporter receptor subunit TctC